MRYLPALLVALLAFAPGLVGGFALDDHHAILGNPVVTGAVPAREAFTRTFWGRPLDAPPPAYRPLPVLLFRLDRALFGLRPLAFHLSSLVAYLAVIFVGQRLAERWLERRAALLAACLFAAMPVHAEAVAGLVGRADVLALGFGLGSLLLLEPRPDGRGPPWIRAPLAALLFAAALLCKESAIVLPGLAALLACVAPGEDGRARRGWPARARALVPALGLAVVAAAYLALRLALLPTTFRGNESPDDVTFGAGPLVRVAHALELLAGYARMIALPVDLCTGRKYAVVAWPDGESALPIAAAVGLLAATAWSTRRALRAGRPPFALLALVSWSVFSSLPFHLPEAMADRFAFAPSYWLALAAGPPLLAFARRGRAELALVALPIALQIGAAAYQSTTWWSTLRLLAHGVTACPDSVHNHLRYGEELARSGEHAEAAWHFAVASEGRRHHPRRWHHPGAEAELALPAEARLARLPALLGVTGPEGPWRAGLARFLAERGHPAEARLVAPAAPGR